MAHSNWEYNSIAFSDISVSKSVLGSRSRGIFYRELEPIKKFIGSRAEADKPYLVGAGKNPLKRLQGKRELGLFRA